MKSQVLGSMIQSYWQMTKTFSAILITCFVRITLRQLFRKESVLVSRVLVELFLCLSSLESFIPKHTKHWFSAEMAKKSVIINLMPWLIVVQSVKAFRCRAIQWKPDFSNPRFSEPPDISNQTLIPLDLLHSSSIISPPISRTLDISKLPITRTNFGSRGTNWPSITRTCENFQTN